MTVEFLREYEDDGFKVTEYTRDGETVSHTIRVPIITETTEPKPTLEELQTQTLINTEYLVTMQELSNLKGE